MVESATYTTKTQSETAAMSFAVRPLKVTDIEQSADIEREAFPTLFPPTSFHHELKNRMASYLVAWRKNQTTNDFRSAYRTLDLHERTGRRTLADRLLQNIGGIWGRLNEGPERERDFIVGFLGTWHMVNEAHIVSIVVRRHYRSRGIGEMLLIGAIEQAMVQRIEIVTLEVRPSNQRAISLYRKYGFSERGVRKNYYADNREDALIMSTDSIHESSYLNLFRELELGHRRRWGIAERKVF